MTTRARLALFPSLFRGRLPRSADGLRRRARPCLEVLENRTVPSTIQGTVFNDLNSDGIRDPGEPGIPGWVVSVDDGAIWMRTNADGTYSLSGLSAGTHTVYSRLRDSIYERTQPATGEQVVTFATDGETATGVDFGNALTAQAPPMEFRVNTTTALEQSTSFAHGRHSVAADDAGNFVVVWSGNGPGDDSGVFFRRFSAAGTPLGGETRVNAVTTGPQSNPAVTRAAGGDFAVLWRSNGDTMVRLYDSAGNPRTGEILVKRDTTGFDVAMADNGTFVVAYETLKGINTRILSVQRYTAAGAVLGKAIQISTTTLVHNNASLAIDADGDFVVGWWDGFQRVDRFGNKQGGVGPASGYATMAMDAAGNFVHLMSQNGVVRAQLYFANGTPRGGPIDVMTPATLPGGGAVAMSASGEFTVTWTGSGGYYPDIYYRHYDANGTPLNDPGVANVYARLLETKDVSVAAADGKAVVVWRGPGPGDEVGVFGQRFTVGSPLRAAGGAKSANATGDALAAAQMKPLLREAIRRWQAAGLSPEQARTLRGINLQITDLGGATLGLASGNTIWLDDNAAGWGWFVDRTPWDNREFTRRGDQGEQGRMDLLSVLMHEMGHVLGMPDHDDPASSSDLMHGSLDAGERRIPAAAPTGGIDRVFNSWRDTGSRLAMLLGGRDRRI